MTIDRLFVFGGGQGGSRWRANWELQAVIPLKRHGFRVQGELWCVILLVSRRKRARDTE